MNGHKFLAGRYYKHRGDCCDFIEVHEVVFDNGLSAEVKVTWYTQEGSSHRRICTDHFVIREKHYVGWREFRPRGERK